MMFSSAEQTIIDRMSSIDRDFAETGNYTPALVKRACTELGVTPTWTLLKKSSKYSRGNYRLNLSGSTVAKVVPLKKEEVVPVQKQTVHSTQPVLRSALTGAVPLVDENYVPFGNYKDVERVVKSKMFFPILITGHSGNGKSTSVIQAHAKNKLPMIRLNMTKKTDEDTLIGSKTLVDGNVVIVEGPIITAMRNGCTVLIEEVDAAETNSIMCLQSILEGKPYYFSALGEYVTPTKGFNLIMTANTKGQGSEDGRYIGTQVLNEAFLERIAFTFEQDYPTPAVEKKIVMNIMASHDCVDEKFADDLVKWADAIRRSFADGALDSLIATRRLEHIVRGFSLFKNKTKAVELGVGRFDTMTKQAFIDLFEKISADDTPVAAETPAVETAQEAV
jgi:hypothetical protein